MGAVKALAHWGALSDKDLEELISWTGVPAGNIRMRFRGEVMISRAIRNPIVRGCRQCLAEDLRGQPSDPRLAMVMKGEWQFRDVCVCLKHRTLLTELWTEMTPARRFDVGARLEEMLGSLLQDPITQPDLVPSAYDMWLDRRLTSGDDPTWMAEIPLVAVTTTCGLLGGELLKLRQEPPPEEVRHAQALAAGFDVLRSGKDAFRTCLNDLALRADGALAEPKRAFGSLYTRMAREFRDDPAFAEFRSVLRECILANWPFAAGETLLGEPVAERRFHSVLTAAQDIGMSAKTLDAILTDAGAFAPSDHRPHSRKIFCAATFAPLLAEIPIWVGPGEMMEGIRAEVDGLLAAYDGRRALPAPGSR